MRIIIIIANINIGKEGPVIYPQGDVKGSSTVWAFVIAPHPTGSARSPGLLFPPCTGTHTAPHEPRVAPQARTVIPDLTLSCNNKSEKR